MDLKSYLAKRGIEFAELDDGKLTVGGYLDLRGTGVTALPDGLTVGDYLDLEGTGVTALPDGLTVGDYLDLEGTGVTALPDGLTVGGYLDLEGTGVTALPDGLTVGGSLDLEGTGVTALPDNFQADSVYLDPKRVSNVAYRENCGRQNRTIFAAWVGDVPHIAAGCFWGPLNAFESAVDENYNGTAAEKYKQAARDCVSELATKLSNAA